MIREDESVACRLCAAPAPECVFRLERSPASVEHLLSAAELSGDAAQPLNVYACRSCGFVQLRHYLGDVFYSNYEMGVGFSKAFQQYLEGLANDFLETNALAAGVRLIEVGCGDGAFLTCLKNRGLVTQGVEPSGPFRQAAERGGHTVYPNYVGRNEPAPHSPYDAVVARQVLEHVFDVNGFLQGINATAGPEASILIEVPSLETALRNGRFFDFFPDHVNYFTATTLRMACESAGFEVLAVKSTMHDEFIAAFGRKVEEVGMHTVGDSFDDLSVAFTQMTADMESLVRSLNALAVEHRKSGRSLAVWGAGGKGVATLAAAEINSFAYVVDSDPHKQGRFMPGSHYQVDPVERLVLEPPDTLILTALAHRGEILAKLRGDLGYRGTVMALGRELEHVELEGL
jgi:hypothetical protein